MMPTESVIQNIRQTRATLAAERNKLMLAANESRHGVDAAKVERDKVKVYRDSLVQRREAIEKEREEMIRYCQQPDSPEALRTRSVNEMTAKLDTLVGEIEFANQMLDKAEWRFDHQHSEFDSLQEKFEATDRQLKELDAHMATLN
jgi:chromosome segregation ATPase